MRSRLLAGAVLRVMAIILAASFFAALLLRFAPGFASDEQELNSGLSASSVQAIREARLKDANIPKFYLHYLISLGRGDLGQSVSLNQPVRTLLHERVPLTLVNLGLALLAAWITGVVMAALSEGMESRWFVAAGEAASGLFISTPAAALALVFVLLRFPAWIAAALLIFPKIYRYASNLLREGYEKPHVLMARAKGAGRWRILLHHVAPVAMPQGIALLGISISMAIGIMLPLEAVCDIPGIGQLAWEAALSRDLGLLVNLTMVVTLFAVSATTLSDAVRRRFARSAV